MSNHPNTLFNIDDCFWIFQDSNKHCLAVGNYLEYTFYYTQLDGLWCKCDPLGLMCSCSYLFLLAGVILYNDVLSNYISMHSIAFMVLYCV